LTERQRFKQPAKPQMQRAAAKWNPSRCTFVRNEPQGHTVIAIAPSGRRWPIIEHMTVMSSATSAMVFSARRYELEVGLGFEGTR